MRKQEFQMSKATGLTLVEVMIILLILSILVAIAVPANYQGMHLRPCAQWVDRKQRRPKIELLFACHMMSLRISAQPVRAGRPVWMKC